MPDPRRGVAIALQLRSRLRWLAWWRAVMLEYPGGVVPLATASRMLGVSRRRVLVYIEEGQLSLIRNPSWGISRDQFVPVDELIRLGSRFESGRPLIVNKDGRIERAEAMPKVSRETLTGAQQSE